MNVQDEKDHLRGFTMSDDTRVMLEIVFNVVLNGVFGVLGSAANVINIIVLIKQGLRDTVNISLCALCVSDLGSLLALAWLSIYSNPLFQQFNNRSNPLEVLYITGGMLHACFAKITSLITAFIAFERCICIALPLKVKNIITSRRILIYIVSMFAIMFSTTFSFFAYTTLVQSFEAKINTTLLGKVYTDNTMPIQDVSYSFNVSVQLSTFIIVIICTGILVSKLVTKSQWRHEAVVASDVSDSMSTRDKRVMKMVTIISIIFIVGYLPNVINLIMVTQLSPDYSETGKYVNSYIVSWAVIFVFEGVNSSVSILVYYNMSSKFRTTFNELFSKSKTSPSK